MTDKTELTDDMLTNLQEHYACDPEFCLRMAEEYLDTKDEEWLIECYNEIFEN